MKRKGLQKTKFLNRIFCLHKNGLYDHEIAEELGVKTSTITYWRHRRLKLKQNYFGNDLNMLRNKRKLNIKKFMRLYRKGLFDYEIGKKMASSSVIVGRWRRLFCLKNNKKKIVKSNSENKKELISSVKRKKIEFVNKTSARCSRCGEVKRLSHFINCRDYKKRDMFYRSYCNSCKSKKWREGIGGDILSYLHTRFFTLRSRSKTKSVKFFIRGAEFLFDLYKKQKGRCFYTNALLEFRLSNNSDYYRNRLSIDRIIPSDGYVENNIVMCTKRANTIKNDLSLLEIKKWLPSWYRKIIRVRPDLTIK